MAVVCFSPLGGKCQEGGGLGFLCCCAPAAHDSRQLLAGTGWDSSQFSLLRLQQAQWVCIWAGGPASLQPDTPLPGTRCEAQIRGRHAQSSRWDLRLHSAPHLSASPGFPHPAAGVAAMAWHQCKAHSVEVSLGPPALPSGDSRPCLSTPVLLPISVTSSLEVCGNRVHVCEDSPCAWSPRNSKLPCSPHAASPCKLSAAPFLLPARKAPSSCSCGPVSPKTGWSLFGL